VVAGEFGHGVGNEVFGAQAFLDVREGVVGGFHEVGAFAAGGDGFGVAAGGRGARRWRGRRAGRRV